MPRTFDMKVILAGSYIEVVKYEKQVWKDFENREKNAGRKKHDDGERTKTENREIAVNRARNEIRRIVNANAGQYGETTKFLTLTYSENRTELQQCNKDFREFIVSLGKYCFKNRGGVKYLVVPEFQKRGAVHYHVVLFNMPYVSTNRLREIWGHGFVKINRISKVDNLGAYICKYLQKDLLDERLEGNKCYSRSQGMLMPIETTMTQASIKAKEIDQALTDQSLYEKTWGKSFQSDHYGDINYSQYVTKNQVCSHELKKAEMAH